MFLHCLSTFSMRFITFISSSKYKNRKVVKIFSVNGKINKKYKASRYVLHVSFVLKVLRNNAIQIPFKKQMAFVWKWKFCFVKKIFYVFKISK